MRISDVSSDVCSSDLAEGEAKPRFKYRTLLFKKRWLTAGAVIILVAGVWIAREPIADEFISDQLDSRGVPARYTTERIGFRSEILSNIGIGDPNRPDLKIGRASRRERGCQYA